jgi:uncharacterized repeat protein (TIGR01451 family)
MERRELLSTYYVENTSDAATPSMYSLRWAIEQVNQDTTQDTIKFDIPPGGVQSIQLTSPLPAITNSVVIDGTKQPNYAGSPLIEIDGSALPSGSNGLVISGGNSTVEGLAVVGFSGSAIVVNSRGSNVIEGNYLGVTTAGNQAEGNGTGITLSGSSNNTIGGTSGAAANVISGNKSDGIAVNGGTAASNNEIIGNLIGTTANGVAPLGNGQAGIAIDGAAGTLIGMPAAGLGNVISGNLGPGIEVSGGATGTAIQNDLIGVAIDGQTPLGNSGDGILLDNAPDSRIGGTDALQGNVIACNKGNGIETADNTAGLLVSCNDVGTDATATLHLGNRGSGVQLGSSSNTIGGTSGGAGNTIEYNGSGQVGAGVQLVGSVTENEILSNSIFGNAGLGINLGDGPTPNHAPGTPGPNDYQNYPTLTLAQSDGSTTTIQGSLYSTPNTNFLIQFFSSPSEDHSGFGQGKVLIGSVAVETDQNGNAAFTDPISVGSTPGQYMSATATDADGNTSEFSADVSIQGEFNLVLSASATPNPVAAGGQVTYKLTVVNLGNISANGVSLTDQLPGTVSFVSASASQGTLLPNTGGSTVTAELGSIAAGGSASVNIVAQTSATFVGSITDTASVTSQGTDPDPSNESASVTTTVQGSADLAIAMSASPNPVLAGGQLTDAIAVSNLGTQSASNVTVTLPLGTGVTFVSASAGTVTASADQVVINLGDMAADASTTLNVVVEPTVAGTLTQTATVSSDSLDPNPGNNTATTNTQVTPAADLAVSLAASVDTANPNVDFSYTVTVTNDGPSAATDVDVADTLPAGVTFVSASAPGGLDPTFSDGAVSLSIAELNAGATASMTIVVDPTAAPGLTLNDSASVKGDQFDPDTANNTATLQTPVRGTSDLAITVSAGTSSLYVGQDVTYTVKATNNGPDDEPDAIVTCPIASDVAFVSANDASGVASLNDGLLTANLGPLARGATSMLTVVLSPQAAAAGTQTTAFTIQGENTDPNPSNNTASTSVQVTPAADLAIGISNGAAAPADGADWTITLNVSNLGLSDATGVTADLPLPATVMFVSAASSQGLTPVDQNGVVSAVLGAMPAGSSATVSVVVMPTAVDSIALTASVSGSQFDPHTANNEAKATVSVVPAVNMNVLLAPTPATVVAGRTLTFTATVVNSGPDPATNAMLSLPLRAGMAFNSVRIESGTSDPVGKLVAGQVVAQLGEMAPGSTVTVTVVVTPTIPGTMTQTASITTPERDLDPTDATASTTVNVLESPGILQFSTSLYSVSETAGVGVLSVTRTGGSLGTVTVPFQITAVNATPGLDFVPTSGTLTFAPGQTAGAIRVPVLADPWDNHDEYVKVALGAPGGGATLGTLSAAELRIIDINPDTTPPIVTRLSWKGTPKAITSVNLSFNSPLATPYALNPANYILNARVKRNPWVQFSSVSYNPATFTVTLVPSAPLLSGLFYQIVVMGTGPAAIRDIAGTLLDGGSNGLPGSNYVAAFAQGTSLQYVDGSGNQVSLKLGGAGYLEDILNSANQGQCLTVVGEVRGRTSLSGSVKKARGSNGRTQLGVIMGLGNWGDVKVSLTSPPFMVRQYPFQRNGRGVL